MISIIVTYSQAEFDKRYDELRKYRVVIPPDPISQGFSGLANLISQVQGYKDRVSELWNEALILKTHAKVQADAAEYAYETALDLMINTDVEVINMPSDRTKVSKANKKLKNELDHVRETKMIHSLIDVYYKTVSNTFNNLESANKNLTEQINMYKRLNPPTGGQPMQPETEPKTSGVKLTVEPN